VKVVAERPSRDDSKETGLFYSLAERGIPRLLSLVHPPLGHDPTPAPRRCHKRHLDAVLANSIRDHGRLSVYSWHPFLLK